LGHRSKRASIEALLGDLVAARIGATFNQYREFGDKEVPGAPAIRLDNLRRYLEEREAARVLAVGEAAGYQGMRWSGIAFTSERDLARWGLPYRPTSIGHPRGWSEPSGTIVHRLLDRLGAERKVVLWNTVPAHPFDEEALSNRRPTAEEIRQGAIYTRRLIEILEPATLIAVGRVAAAVLGDDAVYVRHPANAGASAFADGMRRALMSELPSCPS
jgi:uracil-DNA glycosylase